MWGVGVWKNQKRSLSGTDRVGGGSSVGWIPPALRFGFENRVKICYSSRPLRANRKMGGREQGWGFSWRKAAFACRTNTGCRADLVRIQ